MADWMINLVYENAEIQADIMKLTAYLRNNSEGVVNKGDNMYEVMIDQLNAMKSYQRAIAERINLIQKRLMV